MNLKIFLFTMVFVVIAVNICSGAFEHIPSSTMSLSTGHVSELPVFHPADIFTNPASIVYGDFSTEASWGRLFNQKDLNYGVCAISIPNRMMNIGIIGSTFGNQIYRETILSVSGGRQILKNFQVGVGLSLYQLSIDQYGNTNVPGLNISWRYTAIPGFVWTTQIRNLNAPVIGTDEETLPQSVTTGLATKMNRKFFACAEWEHDLEFQGRLKFGVIYFPLDELSLSAGFCSSPGEITTGFSYRRHNIYVEYAAVITQNINQFSQQVSLGFSYPH